jgi:hypothetical protein
MQKLTMLLLILALWTCASLAQANRRSDMGPTIKLDTTSRRWTQDFITSAAVRVPSA